MGKKIGETESSNKSNQWESKIGTRAVLFEKRQEIDKKKDRERERVYNLYSLFWYNQ